MLDNNLPVGFYKFLDLKVRQCAQCVLRPVRLNVVLLLIHRQNHQQLFSLLHPINGCTFTDMVYPSTGIKQCAYSDCYADDVQVLQTI